MKKIIKKIVILGMTVITLFSSIPATVANAESVSPLHSTVQSTGKDDSLKITYKLTLDKTTVSDGRVAVKYDPNVLVLDKDSEGIKFNDTDVNKKYEDDNLKGIAYAFVNDAAKTVNGTLMTVQFSVKPGLERQDTAIKTYVYTINNDETEIVANTELEDTVTVGREKLAKPVISGVSQTVLGVYVKWNKDTNADGYILYRSTSKDGNYTKVATVSGLTAYWDLLVSNNKTYYYKVVSYQGSGNNRVYSEESVPVSIKVKKFFGLFS